MNNSTKVFIAALVVLSVSLTGCSKEAPDITVAENINNELEATLQLQSSDIQQILQEIRLAAGIAHASNPESCKLLAIGAKPCGGPERFVLYSSEQTDEAQLKALGQRYTELVKQRNLEEGLVSDCSVITPPQVALIDGICVPLRTATH